MSCRLECDSLHFTHQLSHTFSLFSSLSAARLWPKFLLLINLIFVSQISFPTFCPCLICVSLPAHLLPDTCPASLPLMWFVLWWSVPFLHIEQGARSHRCRFDQAQFVHIKDSGYTGGWDLAVPSSEIESFICRRNLFSSRLIPNHDYWALSPRSPDRGDKRLFLEAV